MASQKIPTERESEGLQVAMDEGSLETMPEYSGSSSEKRFLQPDAAFLEESQQNRNMGGRNRRTIFGIPVFWCLIATMTFIIGGGIGAGFAVLGLKKAEKSTSNPPPTATVIATPLPVRVDAAGCPLNNGTTYESMVMLPSTNYTIYCDRTLTYGESFNDGEYTPSLEKCLDSCTNYSKNSTLTKETGPCLGVSWIIQADSNMSNNGKCFFKGSRATEEVSNGWNIVAAVVNVQAVA